MPALNGRGGAGKQLKDIRCLHVPAGRNEEGGVGVVVSEPAIGLAEPVGDGAIVVAPQDIVAAIAVEVADGGHLPGQRNIAGTR